MTDTLAIYADRSFDAASRSGGWAFVVMDGDRPIYIDSGTKPGPSNNTFEVLSVVQAVSWIEREASPASAVIWTDSAHVVEGCDRWRHIWRGNGWKHVRANSHGRRRSIPDANLWQELDGLLLRNPSVRIQVCKGHSGIAGNELADAAAKEPSLPWRVVAARTERSLVYEIALQSDLRAPRSSVGVLSTTLM